MKTPINAHPSGETSKNEISRLLASGLSEDAFYLIALAALLKKEYGSGYLRQMLMPATVPVYKNRTGQY
jgi:hypothetical protein